MNYLTEERQSALAAEYVLGTLQGRARVRFQRLLTQHNSVRQNVWYWERHINELGTALPEQMPHPRVWESIQTRLGFRSTVARLPNNRVTMPVKKSAQRWQWAAGLSGLAALFLAVLLIIPLAESPRGTPSQVAVVQGEKAQALWLIELTENELNIRALENLQAQPDKDYELWMVAADGRAPVSLGLLPKQGEATLPRTALFDQVEIAALAVSLEPLGGSPTGQPTSVIYSTELITL